MEPMLAEFQAEIEGLSFAAPRIPIVSNLTGELLSAEQAHGPRLLGLRTCASRALCRRRWRPWTSRAPPPTWSWAPTRS